MQKLRVLFIGNSHTYFNDMPQVFKNLCEESGTAEVEVAMQAHPGVTYGWHLSQGSEIRFALMHGNYNYIIMQQAAHSPCPSHEETVADGKKIIELARKCGVEPIILQPWAEKRDPAHQLDMYDIYGDLKKQTGVKTSVAGRVFERVLAECPEINLYWHDGEHCSPYGSYVVALAAYCAIFGKSPEGLPAKSFVSLGGTAEDMAAIGEMQKSMDMKNLDMKGENTKKIMAEFAKRFPAIWDKDAIKVDLDKNYAAKLQKMAFEAYKEFNS